MNACEFFLRVLSCDIALRCDDDVATSLLRECYSAFLLPENTVCQTQLKYDISRNENSAGWTIHCNGSIIHCDNRYDLIYYFEKDMTQRVQLLRANYFFIHAAALAMDERCVIISGESGSGKSSLAWFMCHSGHDYLSDELAPVDPGSGQVEPYPHALCLKDKPGSGPVLPVSTQYTELTIHVPAYELPTRAPDRPCPLSLLIFIGGPSFGGELITRTISSAEAAARIYSNGLNQLSHQHDGLPAVANMVRGVPSYLMLGGSVEERAQAVQDLLATPKPH